MTYIISNIKKSLFVVCVSILTLSMFTSSTYAGNPVSVTRGNTASVSWNVNNAACIPTTDYPPKPPSLDDIRTIWRAGDAGSGSYYDVGISNFEGQKVTAVPGSYTFYCTVPNNSATGGTCTGTPGVGAQNTCWDSAVLTVDDCMPGSAWVASSLSCVVQICTANTQTEAVCPQTDPNGHITNTCSPDGTSASGPCVNTSCNSGYRYDGSTGKCELARCVPGMVNDITGCAQVSNGTVSHNCNSYGTGWTAACALTGCTPGWTPVGGVCVPDACPNGAVDAPAPCNQCASGIAWNVSTGQCVVCNGGCSGAGGSRSNPNGGLTCNNGALQSSVPNCNVCPANQNFISNSCQTPTGNFNAASVADCTISNNQSNCTRNVTWTTSGTNSVRLENCTNSTLLANNVPGGAQSLNGVVITQPSTCLRIMDINNNYEITRTTVGANCNSGWSWNVAQGRCRPSACAPHNACDNPSACDSAVGKNYFPAVDNCLVPSGNFTGTPYTCTIADGFSSCKRPVSWTTTNTLAVTLKDSNGAYKSVLGSGAYTYNTGGGVTINYGQVASFYIYDRDGANSIGSNNLIDSVSITASCGGGSTFVGGVCAPIICTPGAARTPAATYCAQTDPHGTVSQICNATGTGWGACTVTACDSTPGTGYQNVGGVCTPIPCTNGCNIAPACNSASGKNYIPAIPGCRVPTGNITLADGCNIIDNTSTCLSNITWATTYTTGGVRLENCTSGGNAVLYTGNATNYNFNVAYGTNCLRLVDVGTGGILGSTVSLNGDCAPGTAIHASGKCRRTTCTNNCTNAPNCDTAANMNYLTTPPPDGSCVTPVGTIISAPNCTILENQPNCKITIIWNNTGGTAKLQDCDVSGVGDYTGWLAAGTHTTVNVTVPHGNGCYRIIDQGTGNVLKTTIPGPLGSCINGTEWSNLSIKCLRALYITPISGTRYFGDPYTFNWTSNADTVDIKYAGNLVAQNIAAGVGAYNVSGINSEPALNNQANTLIFNLIAKKLDLTSASNNVSIGLLYRAVANIGTPTMTGGIVSVPLSCSYAMSYTLNNTSSGASLKSGSGLDKTTTSSDTYTCPLSSCPTGITLNCISDSNGSISAVLDLAALRAHISSFSISPSSVEKNSINNKVALSWGVSALDSCYVSVSAGSNVSEDIAEALSINSMVRSNATINPLPTLKSKDITAGSNVISGISIKHAKVFSLVCGDNNHDGIPEGIYATDPTAIKRVKLNISNTKEQ